MGAGPLFPVRGILAALRKALMPFPKKMKQSEHLDALLQPSSTVDDDRSVLPLHGVVGEDDKSKVKAKTTKAWDDDIVDALLPVKV